MGGIFALEAVMPGPISVTRSAPAITGQRRAYACPIGREVTGNHGAERAPHNTTAPDRFTWSGAVEQGGGCGI